MFRQLVLNCSASSADDAPDCMSVSSVDPLVLLEAPAHPVVVLGSIVGARHRAEVGVYEPLPGLDLEDLPLVLVSLSVVLTGPRDGRSRFPGAVDLGAHHPLLDEVRLRERCPHAIRVGVTVRVTVTSWSPIAVLL